MTRRSFSKVLAAGMGGLGIPLKPPRGFAIPPSSHKGAQGQIKLENGFGIAVSLLPSAGAYYVLCDQQQWVGLGRVSAWTNKRWYASQPLRQEEDKLPLSDTRTGTSQDVLGEYDFADMTWRVPVTGVDLVTTFRLYRTKPYLLFVQKFPHGFKHYGNGDWTRPSVSFPEFISATADLPLTPEELSGGLIPPNYWQERDDLYSWISGGMWNHRLAYGDAHTIQGTVDLLLLADATCRTVILSPLGNYLVATQQSSQFAAKDHITRGIISCGVEGLVREIPAGYEHTHIMVVGQGVQNTFHEWGSVLLGKAGKPVPSKYKDDTLKYLVYMDDAGAYYYEHGFKEEGYNTYEDIILALEQEAKQHGLRIGSYHVLDDPQQRNAEGLFEPRRDLFPHGLAWLHQKLGKPLMLYTKWLQANSPYAKEYQFFETDLGRVPWDSMGDVFYSVEYWKYMARKIASWGGISLQHDWLSTYEGNTAMMSGINKMDLYFKNMARALHEAGIDMQYCMALPRNIMQSTENPVMVSLQGTEDHHVAMAEPRSSPHDKDPFDWKHLIFTSALYGALGIWPSRDNVQTIADPNAFEDTLIANLLGGCIQLGHRIGECNFELLQHTYREGDGLILKPDRPIAPLDRCYREGGVLGYTESRISGKTWYYVLSLPSAGYTPQFTLFDLGVGGKAVVYDWDTRAVSIRDSGSLVSLLRDVKHEYYVVSPILRNGTSVIGDISKFVTMADGRIGEVEDDEESVVIGVIADSTHNPIISGYSARRPAGVEAGARELQAVSSLDRLRRMNAGWFWDYQTRLWHVKVDFASAAGMEIRSFRIRK